METKYAIVIDDQGYKIESVLVDFIERNDDTTEIPQEYTLQDGENLVYDDIPIALHMKTPRWNGETWEETATPEEIAADLPEPVIVKEAVSDMDVALAEYMIEIESRFLELEGKING